MVYQLIFIFKVSSGSDCDEINKEEKVLNSPKDKTCSSKLQAKSTTTMTTSLKAKATHDGMSSPVKNKEKTTESNEGEQEWEDFSEEDVKNCEVTPVSESSNIRTQQLHGENDRNKHLENCKESLKKSEISDDTYDEGQDCN